MLFAVNTYRPQSAPVQLKLLLIASQRRHLTETWQKVIPVDFWKRYGVPALLC